MPPTRLCSVDSAKHKGNVNVAYEYDDDGIVRAIRAATISIFSATRRTWVLSDYTDRIPVPRAAVRGTFRIWTSVRPLWVSPVVPRLFMSASIAAPKVQLPASSYVIINAADGRIDLDPAALVTSRTPGGDGLLTVMYVGGLGPSDTDPDVFDAPVELEHACAMQAAYIYDRMVNSRLGVKQASGKTGATTYAQYVDGLIPEVYALVARHVRPLTAG